jgi:non-specific serine/threonine protein kinase
MAEIVPDTSTPSVPKAPPVAHVDALPPGTRLAEFEVQGLLGVGGFGLVYRAYDTSLHRAVAIKEYMPAALAARLDGVTVSVRSSNDQATYQSGLQSFVAEARLLAQFDHPSLVKVYRIWEANNTAYMVMPLYSGVTLSEARSQMTAPPPEAWLRTVMWSILQALHVLHQHNTLHRDISPDNIFLQDMGPPVLLDLGAARRAINDRSHRLTAVLKVNYAPIEQYAEATDLAQGPWTDLYALAAAIYNCLRNAPPLPATARVVSDSMPSVRSVAATVKEHFGIEYSDTFVRTITHALAVRPADRPQSLAAFVTEMRLKAPPRLSKFDWRSELGAALRTDEDENHSRQFWQTQPQTLPDPSRQATPAAQPAGRRNRSASGGKRSGALWRKLKWVLLLVVGPVAVALLLWWLLGGPDQAGHAPLVASPEPAAMPAPAPAPTTSEPPQAVTEVAPPPSEVAKPVTPASAPVAKPAPPSRPAARSHVPVSPKPAAVEEERKPAAKPAAPKAVVPEPPPKPTTPPEVRSPVKRELCASANFFTRPMCIHLECQKAENAQLPVCIEDRKRYPDGRSTTQP